MAEERLDSACLVLEGLKEVGEAPKELLMVVVGEVVQEAQDSMSSAAEVVQMEVQDLSKMEVAEVEAALGQQKEVVGEQKVVPSQTCSLYVLLVEAEAAFLQQDSLLKRTLTLALEVLS